MAVAGTKKATQKVMKDPPVASKLVQRFAASIVAYRTKKKLSQRALADRMGISVSYVSMLERGKRNPPLSTVEDAAKALDTKPVVLLG